MAAKTEAVATRFRSGFITLLTAAILTSIPATATDSPPLCPVLTAARRALMAMTPFKANFIQQVYYGDELAVEEKGDLLFVNPRKVRWNYRDPELKVFLLENGKYRFWEPEADQLTVGNLGARNGGWIWQLMVDGDPELVEECRPSGKAMVVRDPAGDTRFRIILDKTSRIVRVEHEDAGGALYIYRFSDYREQVTLSPGDFRLDVPAGTEVVHMDRDSP